MAVGNRTHTGRCTLTALPGIGPIRQSSPKQVRQSFLHLDSRSTGLDYSSEAFTYGGDYPGTQFDYGQASQFATTRQCGGPFGPDSTYCDTVLNPTP
jgi:hypothetical protein